MWQLRSLGVKMPDIRFVTPTGRTLETDALVFAGLSEIPGSDHPVVIQVSTTLLPIAETRICGARCTPFCLDVPLVAQRFKACGPASLLAKICRKAMKIGSASRPAHGCLGQSIR